MLGGNRLCLQLWVLEVSRAADDAGAPGMDEEERQMAVDRLEEQMLAAAANLDFEKAAKLRDQMLALKGEKAMGTEEKSRMKRRRRERTTHRNPG